MTDARPAGKRGSKSKADGKKEQPAEAAGEVAAGAGTPAAADLGAPEAAAPVPLLQGLPPMYTAIEALSAARHGKLKLRRAESLAHAASLSSIIIAASEVPAAARDYPVVFSDHDTQAMPYVVTGYAEGVNLHVDDNGAWRKDAYIPAYVRRYPFIFIEAEHGKRQTLAIDPAAPMLSQTEGAPLYEADGSPSDTTRSALAFCKAYKAEMERTRELVRQIVEAGITVSRRADVNLPGGRKASVGGFRIVDEAKLAALADETFLALRKSGALTLVYCHLTSMAAWRNLLA